MSVFQKQPSQRFLAFQHTHVNQSLNYARTFKASTWGGTSVPHPRNDIPRRDFTGVGDLAFHAGVLRKLSEGNGKPLSWHKPPSAKLTLSKSSKRLPRVYKPP